MRDVKIQIINSMAKEPIYSSPEAAGVDLVACIDSPIELTHGNIVRVPTGIKLAAEDSINRPFCYFLCGRSGLGAKHGITLANSVGIIDSDYRGELIVGLINNSNENYTINPGDRIAQLIFVPIERMNFNIVNQLDNTERGSGGFGSTGR